MPYTHPENFLFYDAPLDFEYISSQHQFQLDLQKTLRINFANKNWKTLHSLS